VREKRSQAPGTPSSGKAAAQVSFLAQSDIFRHLNPAEISELDHIVTMISCAPGRILYRPGEKGSVLFLLKTGCVQLYHLSADGRKLITATLRAGDCFGEMPLIGQGTHSSFAEAMEESLIGVMNRHDIEHLLTRKPSVAFALLKVVGARLAQIEAQLIDATFKSTSARLATLLLQLAHSPEGESKRLVVDGLSHEELAERLGVYRETVSTALRELREAGAIEMGRKHITISQPALLADMAAPGYRGGR
jgi:CRP/FNR family cyclic AMP-dependent transcriptional regulator